MDCYKIVSVFFLVCAGVAVSVDESRSACCPDGEYLIKTNNSYFCVASKKATPKPISITCPPEYGMQWFIPHSGMTFRVNKADQLKISLKNRMDITYENDRFCVNNRSSFNAKRVAIVCYLKDTAVIGDHVYGYCMIASAIFLLITAVYYAVRKELRDLQGKSVIQLCSSLGMGLAILAVMRLMSYSDMNLCAARGFFAYFFMIATFFWMNALSIQILMNSRRPSNSNEEEKSFVWYSVYAWGSPAILTILMAVINFTPGSHLKPGIGLNHCWFFDHSQQWIYMYSVMTVLIAVNICIFVYALRVLWTHSVSTDTKAVTHRFLTTIKLFIVMGLPWIFDMISSVAPKHLAWEILDLANTLQGVYIFIVLVVFPCMTRRESSSSEDTHGGQYHTNIIASQPYKKFEC